MLYFDILKNQRIEAKRNLTDGKDKFARLLIFLSIAFWAAYLLFLGATLPSVFRAEWPETEPYDVLDKCLMPILFIDFIIRLTQSSPAHTLRPYLLLPLSRKKVIQSILLNRIIQPHNLFWLFFFVPFALSSIAKVHGMAGVAGYTLGIWLLMVMNNYWSLLINTLKRQRFAYLLWALIVYLPLTLLEVWSDTHWVSSATMHLAKGFILWKPWSFAITTIFIALFFVLNYNVQTKLIYQEIQDNYEIKKQRLFGFLRHAGNIGEYMALDIKMIFRNKRLRTKFWSAIFVTSLFAAALAADLYEDNFMKHFICLYCYTLLGAMSLSKLMSAEGNYIDGLMVRKESIYHLLCAQYYLQCIFLILPFSICMLPVALGRIPLLMSVAYLMFTLGVTFCGLMQMAVYNHTTIPLNATATVRRRINSTWFSVVIGASLSIPLLVCKILFLLFNETTAYLLLILLGTLGFATHRLWIRNIYIRMMKRRYQNLEGFRNTR